MKQKIELVTSPQELLIPDAVLRNMVTTGQIETIEPKWMDERRYCGYAIDNDPADAANCPNLKREPGRVWCSLNGSERLSPCVFAEPESAQVWQDIKAYVAECKARGWM